MKEEKMERSAPIITLCDSDFEEHYGFPKPSEISDEDFNRIAKYMRKYFDVNFYEILNDAVEAIKE